MFYLNQAAPFGGVKASGHGRFGKFAIPTLSRADPQPAKKACGLCVTPRPSAKIGCSPTSGPAYPEPSVSGHRAYGTCAICRASELILQTSHYQLKRSTGASCKAWSGSRMDGLSSGYWAWDSSSEPPCERRMALYHGIAGWMDRVYDLRGIFLRALAWPDRSDPVVSAGPCRSDNQALTSSGCSTQSCWSRPYMSRRPLASHCSST